MRTLTPQDIEVFANDGVAEALVLVLNGQRVSTRTEGRVLDALGAERPNVPLLVRVWTDVEPNAATFARWIADAI